MILFKGAAPGTYWHTNDARTSGGFTVSPGVKGVNAVVSHITAFSHPSPYCSLTASYAVAFNYAELGPGGLATANNPGYIYEVDVLALQTRPGLLDPVKVIVDNNPELGVVRRLPTQHDGAQDLILGIASSNQRILTRPPLRKGHMTSPTGAGQPGPLVDPELHALVFALRDSEVLASEHIPAACIVTLHQVY